MQGRDAAPYTPAPMGTAERAPLLYRALHATLTPILQTVYRPFAEGVEYVPRTGPAILASNHLSFADHFFFPMLLERPVYFLGKAEYFDGWQRHFFENVGVMPIQRGGGKASEASLRRGQQILEEGKLLGIYPEGTRSPDGRLYRGKTGPARLAIRTGVPIIPVAMVGVDQVLPAGKILPKVRDVGVRVGAPLDFSRYEGREADRTVLRQATDELMYELMLLSGQEYVDEYAAKVKAGEVIIGSGDFEELGRAGSASEESDEDDEPDEPDGEHRRAS